MKTGKKEHILQIVLVTMLIASAVFLRLYRLPEFLTFLGDQGRDAIIIKRIITFEHLPAIGPPTSIGQVYLGPFFYYLMSPFLLIARFNPVGLGLATSFLTIIALIFAFRVVKKKISQAAAIIFLSLYAFSFVNIEFARFAWNPNLLPVFSFFTLYFFYKTLTDKKIYYSILFGSFLSFSIQLHYLAVLLMPSLLAFGIVYLAQHKAIDSLFKKLGLAIASFLFFSLPLFIFDLRHDFLNSKNFIRMFSEPGNETKISILQRVSETVHAVTTHISMSVVDEKLSLTLFIILIIIGFTLCLKKKMHLLVLLFFFNTLFYLLGFSFFSSPRYPHYFTPVYLSIFVYIAYLLTLIPYKKISYIIVACLLVFYINANSRSYYFLTEKGSNQVERARITADSVAREIKQSPYQMVALPVGETDGQIRYFLEINGKTPLPENSLDEPKELFVLCYEKTCNVDGHPQWQIASFKRAVTDKIWSVKGITIYKLVHGNK